MAHCLLASGTESCVLVEKRLYLMTATKALPRSLENFVGALHTNVALLVQ